MFHPTNLQTNKRFKKQLGTFEKKRSQGKEQYLKVIVPKKEKMY